MVLKTDNECSGMRSSSPQHPPWKQTKKTKIKNNPITEFVKLIMYMIKYGRRADNSVNLLGDI